MTEAVFGEADTAVAQSQALGHRVSTCHGDGGMGGLARHAWTYLADQLAKACDDVQSSRHAK